MEIAKMSGYMLEYMFVVQVRFKWARYKRCMLFESRNISNTKEGKRWNVPADVIVSYLSIKIGIFVTYRTKHCYYSTILETSFHAKSEYVRRRTSSLCTWSDILPSRDVQSSHVRQPLFLSNFELLFLLEYLLTNRLGHEACVSHDISSLNRFPNKQVFSHCSSSHLQTKTEEGS